MATAMSMDAPVSNGARESLQGRYKHFLEVFKQLKGEILADPMLTQQDAAKWMSRMMDYNVVGGKLNRGLSVKDTLLVLKPDASEEDQLQADRVGWAIEFLQVCRGFRASFPSV
jgi:farnesyl diphosphate synthase